MPADNSEIRLARLGRGLELLGWLMLGLGFAAPWVYGVLGKSADFGWQPVWGLLLRFLPANVFVLAAIANCFSYLELTYRRGQPVLAGVLRWVGGFLVLLALPLTWFILDQTGRGRISLHEEGTLGWGVWLALLGLLAQVAALSIKIYLLNH